MAVLGQQHPLDRVVERIDAALDEGHSASLIGLDQAATANLLRGLAQVASRLDALTATVLAHATQVRVEETNGATTTATWWADATHRTRATAHRDVKLAVALSRFTALAEALAEGRVNTEQAHAIARALSDLESDGPAELEPVVVEQAEKHLVDCADGFDAKHLKVLGRHVLTVVAPEVGEAHEAKLLEDEERRAAEKTRLTFASDGHGMVHGRFSIPALHGAMLAKAIQALTWATQDPAEVRQSKPTPVAAGQAFTELLERMDAADLPSVGGVGATVVVTMTIDSLTGGLAAAALDTGEVISASAARRLACEAGVIPMVLGGKSEVLDVGRRRRFHTRAQRLAIAQRDKTCVVGGCDAPPSRCHVHHVIPWSEGGGTSVKDGRLYCSAHHAMIHDPKRSGRLRK
ncbi:HNH endonuclease signature motif containing protein [uncultured Nocardioides sp.]|uniref:HNH endonuclease signature motif containing protein n=2 Tax=uncultured Nocardioides sp. TaxID=198441 RepID=UPI0026165335|nr:HNH endonuclease signature motif containing protein [uncultured Nocardioides sp.]